MGCGLLWAYWWKTCMVRVCDDTTKHWFLVLMSFKSSKSSLTTKSHLFSDVVIVNPCSEWRWDLNSSYTDWRSMKTICLHSLSLTTISTIISTHNCYIHSVTVLRFTQWNERCSENTYNFLDWNVIVCSAQHGFSQCHISVNISHITQLWRGSLTSFWSW